MTKFNKRSWLEQKFSEWENTKEEEDCIFIITRRPEDAKEQEQRPGL